MTAYHWVTYLALALSGTWIGAAWTDLSRAPAGWERTKAWYFLVMAGSNGLLWLVSLRLARG